MNLGVYNLFANLAYFSPFFNSHFVIDHVYLNFELNQNSFFVFHFKVGQDESTTASPDDSLA